MDLREEILALARERGISEIMVPRVIVTRGSIPLLATGLASRQPFTVDGVGYGNTDLLARLGAS